MSLKYKKFYVDTKYKTPDSESNSNFSIELPEECNILNYFMRMLIVKILREEKL